MMDTRSAAAGFFGHAETAAITLSHDRMSKLIKTCNDPGRNTLRLSPQATGRRLNQRLECSVPRGHPAFGHPMNLQRCLRIVFATSLLLTIHASNSSDDDDDYYDGFLELPHGLHVPEPATAPFGQVTVGEAQLAESAEHLWRAAIFSLFLGGSLSAINGLVRYDWLQLSARVRVGLDISHCLLWMFTFTMWVVSLWVEFQLGHYNFP